MIHQDEKVNGVSLEIFVVDKLRLGLMGVGDKIRVICSDLTIKKERRP